LCSSHLPNHNGTWLAPKYPAASFSFESINVVKSIVEMIEMDKRHDIRLVTGLVFDDAKDTDVPKITHRSEAWINGFDQSQLDATVGEVWGERPAMLWGYPLQDTIAGTRNGPALDGGDLHADPTICEIYIAERR
jgi:hypothetical protein